MTKQQFDDDILDMISGGTLQWKYVDADGNASLHTVTNITTDKNGMILHAGDVKVGIGRGVIEECWQSGNLESFAGNSTAKCAPRANSLSLRMA